MERKQISLFVLFFLLFTGCKDSVDEVLENPSSSTFNQTINETILTESVQAVQVLMDIQPLDFKSLMTSSPDEFMLQLDSVMPDSLGIQKEILEEVQQIEFQERLPDETLVEYFEKAGISEAIAEKFASLEDDISSFEDLEEEFVTPDGFLDVEKLSDSVKDKFTKIKEAILVDHLLNNNEKLAVLISLEMMIGMSDDIVMMAVNLHAIDETTSPVARTEGLFKRIANGFKKVINSYVNVASMIISHSVVGGVTNAIVGGQIGGSAAGVTGFTTGALAGAALGYGYGVIVALDRIIDNDCGALGNCFGG